MARTPSFIWMVSPGSPMMRLMKSIEGSRGSLNTTTSPRFGSVKKTRPGMSGRPKGSE